ncbi:MAG TPA: 50S ribosomal protein L15 [Candidatus Saccharimonadales bacterium]|nr:50S ribosomal protein L15 [Candidatus Saccharimonadales bacterium]
MSLNKLTKIKTKKLRRLGRGPGSGRGKTSGKGQKGQNARGKLPITHSHQEGGQRPIFKRLPYRRGKGNKSLSKKPIAVNVEALNKLPKNSRVNIELLIEHRIVEKSDAKIYGVKILGNGKVENVLTIVLPISKSAAQKIEKAGGKIETVPKTKKELSKKTAHNNEKPKAKTEK